MSSYNICKECNLEYTNPISKWCKPCHSKHFQNDFINWTSGNDKIDKFIQDAQLNANYNGDVLEWIPYYRFNDVKEIGRGGFGTIHYARWIDGSIEKRDIENKDVGVEVALKKFDNFVNFNDVLNEMEIHLKIYVEYGGSIKFYGITQDPETYKYMIVLEYAKDGSLREYLKINFNNINWSQKLFNLWYLSYRLKTIHELDIVHQDFHPGNILSSNFKKDIQISDFGLKVLSGDEEYTKAADVYSFGIIAYEMVTGFPPYPDIPHIKDLAMKICNGLRPKIPFQIPKLITRMIMRCWDARVTHRPTFNELSNSTTPTPLNYQTHPQEIYTSRLLNFSKLPKPKNEESFERELEELTRSELCPSNSDLFI
ncbi:hypothetical protein Glove_86g88 [Diversispora epigaea]|uniref:Protein kinase domain-containing protein n=1 Tax=Diversispora epigaea TaxID=1348612 RepID=A0A397J6J5_9GLOM|nr:hypothetical protein Glove_86g88 [Diversispora epigaea]